MTNISKIQRAHSYIYKNQKENETFFIQKAWHYKKKQDNLRYVSHTKIQTLYIMRFFIKNWNWYLYTKSMTLCVMWSFIYTKYRPFAKSKTICVTFLCTKNLTLCVMQLPWNFWNWHMGGTFLCKKRFTFRYILDPKKMHFPLRLYI